MPYYNREQSHREYISELYGGIDDDIRELFFNLPPDRLEDVFRGYERQYGKSKADYAKRAFLEWKSGKVTMSGEISERLLKFLPFHLEYKERYELIKSLWIKLQPMEYLEIKLYPDSKLEAVSELILNNVKKNIDYRIPDGLKNRLKWLFRDDSKLAESLMKKIHESEGEIIAENAKLEIKDILSTIENDNEIKIKGSKSVRFANTHITFYLQKPSIFRRLFNGFK